MVKKGRVLYHGKEGEMFIEADNIEERLVFIAPNKAGFSGYTLLDLENQAKSMMTAYRELTNVLEELKERVNDKVPAMLGYDSYVSKSQKQEELNKKTEDSVLRDLKAYTDERDAI